MVNEAKRLALKEIRFLDNCRTIKKRTSKKRFPTVLGEGGCGSSALSHPVPCAAGIRLVQWAAFKRRMAGWHSPCVAADCQLCSASVLVTSQKYQASQEKWLFDIYCLVGGTFSDNHISVS